MSRSAHQHNLDRFWEEHDNCDICVTEIIWKKKKVRYSTVVQYSSTVLYRDERGGREECMDPLRN